MNDQARRSPPGSLQGHRVMVTAEAKSSARLAALLADLGACPVILPCITIEPPEDPGVLRSAVQRLPRFDWVVITSRNGATSFIEAVAREKSVSANVSSPRIAAVGTSTARHLEASGLSVSLVPSIATSAIS